MKSPRARPISYKGVVLVDDHVLLLLNDRDEYELPGGRADGDEGGREAVAREVLEEVGLEITATHWVDRWLHRPTQSGDGVWVSTYATEHKLAAFITAKLSAEHIGQIWAPITDLASVPMPDGYRRSILKAARPGHVVQ